ncbi:hypothetical protein [Laspinema olomoucense]|uniref:hypothetical protein n=1 Tax=Laspinema olomoucense TaxID=3231600 RepID=UPI0021BA847F|nr:hypothetical protein [Laspinema sp. D3c]MCT7992570.1 hypothetical protein [Laspinema sp. D3c]
MLLESFATTAARTAVVKLYLENLIILEIRSNNKFFNNLINPQEKVVTRINPTEIPRLIRAETEGASQGSGIPKFNNLDPTGDVAISITYLSL